MILASDLPRLRWRCRRGMRELDQLLMRYLDRCWQQSDDEERGLFLQLLEIEDDTLWRCFISQETHPDAPLDSLIQRIRALPT